MGIESESSTFEFCEVTKADNLLTCANSARIDNLTMEGAVEHGKIEADCTPPCKREPCPSREKSKRFSSVMFRESLGAEAASPTRNSENDATFETIDSNEVTNIEHESLTKSSSNLARGFSGTKYVVKNKKNFRIASEHDTCNSLQPRKLFVQSSSEIKRKLAVSTLNRSYEIDDDLSGYGEEDVLSPDPLKSRPSNATGLDLRGVAALDPKSAGNRPCSLAAEEDVLDIVMETPAVRPKEKLPVVKPKRLVRRNAFCESDVQKQESIDNLSFLSLESNGSRDLDKSANKSDLGNSFESSDVCAKKLDLSVSITSITNSDNDVGALGSSFDNEQQGNESYQTDLAMQRQVKDSKAPGVAGDFSGEVELGSSYSKFSAFEKCGTKKSESTWEGVPEFIKAQIEKQRGAKLDRNNNSIDLKLFKSDEELCPIETEKDKEVNKKVVEEFLSQSLRQHFQTKTELTSPKASICEYKTEDLKRQKSLDTVINNYSNLLMQHGADEEALSQWLEKSLIVEGGFCQEEVAELQKKVEAHFADGTNVKSEGQLRNSYEEFFQNREAQQGSVFVFPDVGTKRDSCEKDVTLFCFACNEYQLDKKEMLPKMPFCNEFCNLCRECMLNEVRERAKLYLFNRVAFGVQCLTCNQPMVDQLLGKDGDGREISMASLYKEWLLTNIVPHITDLDERRVVLDFITLFSF